MANKVIGHVVQVLILFLFIIVMAELGCGLPSGLRRRVNVAAIVHAVVVIVAPLGGRLLVHLVLLLPCLLEDLAAELFGHVRLDGRGGRVRTMECLW